MSEEEFITKFYSCDNEEQFLKDVHHNLNCLQQENSQLKEDIKELEFIVGLRQKRNLIKKFDKEYDFEDKQKKPNRDYVCITPDAEEVYKRYYDYKERIEKAINKIEEFNKKEKLSMYVDTWKHLLPILKILKGDKE